MPSKKPAKKLKKGKKMKAVKPLKPIDGLAGESLVKNHSNDIQVQSQ
jgi:hypothetical protein